MQRDAAIRLIQQLLKAMKERGASDLFLTKGFPPAMKIDGQMNPVMKEPLTSDQVAGLVRAIMNDRQLKSFEETKECNFAISPDDIGRFRVNAFVQQGHAGAVLRTIETEIPDFEKLQLPPALADVVLEKRGLVLMVGGTGSGKSTSLAAMIGLRNKETRGHIITIEDPVEFVHPHLGCIVTQREVGVDTDDWEIALKNTLRQAPDVILIGEIRARETMEHAINFAETGHLALATLHANSANQALDRIINFFPEEKREQLLMDLSLNLKAIISQRLLRKENGGRVAAVEVLLNSPLIQEMIFKGEVGKIKEVMTRSKHQGMQTFDMALFDLFEDGKISFEEAMRNADSKNELRLRVKLESRRGATDLLADEGVGRMSLLEDEDVSLRRQQQGKS
ncbi:MAG: PilT/PilU family type 4a pilus ATPase [Oceanococcaceae bacterium]